MDRLEEARQVFNIEIEALKKMRDSLDVSFLNILDEIIKCEGKVIITGVGKPGHIAKKMAATFASLGTPSFFLHPAEAMHGDLGMISSNDVVIAISYSGESDEIVKILSNIKAIGALLVGITGNNNSTLARVADIVQLVPKFEEACHLGLAPTSSTSAVLCYGDALAVVASGIYGFKSVDFGKFHPSGALGKKLVLKVDDLMVKDTQKTNIRMGATLKEAIAGLSRGYGMVSVVDETDHLLGIITDGDIRRQLEKEADIYVLQVEDIMTKNPIVMETGHFAIEALNVLKEKRVSSMPILQKRKVVGIIRVHDIIEAGIVG